MRSTGGVGEVAILWRVLIIYHKIYSQEKIKAGTINLFHAKKEAGHLGIERR